MPDAAVRPCTGGCGALVRRGRCPACATKVRKQLDAARPSAHARGYTREWRKASTLYLRAHPMCMCADCKGEKLPAQVVDHKTPHRGDMQLFWNPGNWQPMAKVCHDRKTATEDGGFGNVPSPTTRKATRT